MQKKINASGTTFFVSGDCKIAFKPRFWGSGSTAAAAASVA